jgi:peptide/nickel transport system ATP-binding protein
MSLLELDGVKVHFPIKKGILFDRTVGHVYAVDGVSLKVEAGQTYGLVGESGCGKTTLGRAVLRLVDITEGSVVLDGTDLAKLSGEEMRRFRRRLQMVFQDPLGSLNPRQNIESILTEGMIAHGIGKNQEERREKIKSILERVGLPPTPSPATRTSSPAVSASASASPAPWSSNRTSSSATSRSPRSTCRSRPRSSTCWRSSRTSSA